MEYENKYVEFNNRYYKICLDTESYWSLEPYKDDTSNIEIDNTFLTLNFYLPQSRIYVCFIHNGDKIRRLYADELRITNLITYRMGKITDDEIEFNIPEGWSRFYSLPPK